MQTLEVFQPLIAFQDQCNSPALLKVFEQLHDAIVVHRVADNDGHRHNQTARRILDQLLADLDQNPAEYRKPVHYIAGNDEGLALAITVDDRFWTSDW